MKSRKTVLSQNVMGTKTGGNLTQGLGVPSSIPTQLVCIGGIFEVKTRLMLISTYCTPLSQQMTESPVASVTTTASSYVVTVFQSEG